MLVSDAYHLLSNRPLYVPPSRWYPDIEEGTVVPWTLLALLYVAMLAIPLRELLKFSHLGIDPLGDVLGFRVQCRESLARLEGLPAAPGQSGTSVGCYRRLSLVHKSCRSV